MKWIENREILTKTVEICKKLYVWLLVCECVCVFVCGSCNCVLLCVYVWEVYSAYVYEGKCTARCFYRMLVVCVSYFATLLLGKNTSSISVCVGDYN